MGAPGSEFVIVRKVGGSPATTIAIAAADSAGLTAGGNRIGICAVHWNGPTAAGATGAITIGDGATNVITLTIPTANLTFYQDFATPLPITSGTNDMRVTATFASQNAAVLVVWYKPLM